MKKRLSNYDLIRVISCFFVILIHIKGKPFSEPVKIAYTTVFYISNAMFYMLSGTFNLGNTFDSTEDYKNFYKKRFVSILFPFMLFSFLQSIWNMYLEMGAVNWKSYWMFAYTEFMDTNGSKATWFMYPLMGFILSAPFLSKMLHAMTDRECKILLIAAVIWNSIRIYCTLDLGVNFAFSGWLLESWILYFVCGYIYNRIFNDRNKIILYIMGAAGYLITVAGRYFLSDHFVNATDLSPAFLFTCLAVYYFLVKNIRIRNRFIGKTVSFVAEHTFIIYLFHAQVMRHVVPRISDFDTTTFSGFILEGICIFFFSFIGALIFRNLILRPLQFLLKKLPFLRPSVTKAP